MYSLVNEGAKVLEEGIALRPGDVDVIWTAGYGFPRFRGGPLFYASAVGIARIYEAVCENHKRFGDYWRPSHLLERLARAGKGFESWEEV